MIWSASVTGRGTHDEMLRRHEGYARLYSLHRERPSVGASLSTGAVPSGESLR